MLEVIPSSRENTEQLIRRYKKKLRQVRLISRLKKKLFFEKFSERRKKQRQKAIARERYKRTHGLV